MKSSQTSPKKSPQTLRLKFAPQPPIIPEPTTVEALLQAGGCAVKGYFTARWASGSARNGDLSTLVRSLPKYARPRFYLLLSVDGISTPGVICIDRNCHPRERKSCDDSEIRTIWREWDAERATEKELLRAA